MQLRELVLDFSYRVINGSLDTEVTSFTCDSRKISPGCLFVCIHGQEYDGHHFIQDALECQAAVLVTERLPDSIMCILNQKTVPFKTEVDITILLVANTKKALAFISARFFERPANKMVMIGITGTKGKTTTAYMLRSILQYASDFVHCNQNKKIKCGLIGTNGWMVEEEVHMLSYTTPLASELHRILHQMYMQGCTHVVMEVSSIGMKEQRVYGIQFQYGIYTNLFSDHIGGKEHRDFEEYKYWKSQFFSQCEVGIFNEDDCHWHEMANACSGTIATYSLKKGILNGNQLQHCIQCQKGKKFGNILTIDEKKEILVPLPGNGNCNNALGAILCACHCKIPFAYIALGIANTVIKGRTELVCSGNGISVFIDYAHNGDSLRQLLMTLREYNPKRLICLFGCGGNRSKERRYAMGIVSGTLADLTILTEDNSRDENPEDIIKEICQGVEEVDGKYMIILNRAEAIQWAISEARDGDVIVLAGKGHESYQEKGGVKSPFSEHEIVNNCWKTLKGCNCSN